jgi:hypothetical protein
MKRQLLLVVLSMICITSVILPSASAERAGMPKRVQKRTVSAGYNYVASSSEEPIQYNVVDPLEIDVRKNERWAVITVEDATTMAAGADVTQDVDGDGTADLDLAVCGSTPEPVKISGNAPLTITPGACTDGPGAATSGKVHVELYSPSPKTPPMPKVERTEVFTYTGWFFESDTQQAAGSYYLDTLPTEVYIDISSTDASGLPAHIEVSPETGRGFEVCGGTDEPILIEPTSSVYISVFPTPCSDGTPAAMTTGDIEVTLTNRL